MMEPAWKIGRGHSLTRLLLTSTVVWRMARQMSRSHSNKTVARTVAHPPMITYHSVKQCQTVSNSAKRYQTMWNDRNHLLASPIFDMKDFFSGVAAEHLEPNATNCFCAMEETPWKPCIFPPMPSHLSRFFCKSSKRILKLHIDHQRLSYCSTEWEPRWPETPKRQRFSLLGWCWMRKAASSPKFGERLWENRMKQHDYTRQKGTRSMLLPLEGKLRSCKPWCSWDPWKTQKASKSHGN